MWILWILRKETKREQQRQWERKNIELRYIAQWEGGKKPAGNEWIGGGGKEGEGWREMEIEEM